MATNAPPIDVPFITAVIQTMHGIALAGPDGERVARTVAEVSAGLARLTAGGLFDTEPAQFYGFIEAQATEGTR